MMLHFVWVLILRINVIFFSTLLPLRREKKNAERHFIKWIGVNVLYRM